MIHPPCMIHLLLLLQYVFIPFLHMSLLMKACCLIFVIFRRDDVDVYEVTHLQGDLFSNVCVCVSGHAHVRLGRRLNLIFKLGSISSAYAHRQRMRIAQTSQMKDKKR